MKSHLILVAVALFAAPVALSGSQTPYPEPKPSPLAGLDYGESLFPDGADHDPAIPQPESLLGFGVGDRAASSRDILEYVQAVAGASDRVELVEYGYSYEGRPLVYLVISSPGNLERQESIREGLGRLADSRGLSSADRDQLTGELPAVAWMAYSIHGNESSGADASMAVVYHLAADRSEATSRLLDEVVVIVDPNMNPDGRQRFIDAIGQTRGAQPNVDDQSLVHSGYWPYGRGNHYLFDLNRDWIYARHPETRGRIPHIIDWRPQLFVDAHEMGARDTFLFSPAREPHNPNFPPYRYELGNVYADDTAKAFDVYGYPYYSGEWHEDWYPGYTDAWASLRGAQGILYEQARIAEDGVQRDSHLLSYRQAVHHQLIATWANLETLRANRRDILARYAADRAEVVSAGGPYGERSFVILPTDNRGRLLDLLDLLRVQQFEAHRLTRSQRTPRAVDQLGRELRNVELPEGAIVLRNRQPEGRLLAAMFEFDPRLSEHALTREREAILRRGGSTIYDTTGWNISMMFGLEALTVPRHLDAGLEPVDLAAELERGGRVDAGARPAALVSSGADDRALALAGRLMERGVQVRANVRPSELEGHVLPIGSVAVLLDDNRDRDDWIDQVRSVAAELGLDVHGIGHGRAPGELADLGGRQWRLLTRPQIALLSRGSNNMLDFGAVWYVLDHRLGLRHSHLDENRIGRMDLRRYNVLYLPERWGGDSLPEALIDRLGDWVRAGGTLVAVGNAARALTSGDEPLVASRTIEQVLDEDLAPWQDAVFREWLAARQLLPDAGAIWGHAAGPAEYPWAENHETPSVEERKRRDQWQRLFMPSGALVATRVDGEHWLAAGAGEFLNVLFSNSPVLMARPPVEAPLRIGVYSEADRDAGLVNWAPVPEGLELRVRAGGLLWPEARERIASAAWMTRESVGNGQVILFAHPPAFRAAQLGAIRLLENAFILGPGLGTGQPLELP